MKLVPISPKMQLGWDWTGTRQSQDDFGNPLGPIRKLHYTPVRYDEIKEYQI